MGCKADAGVRAKRSHTENHKNDETKELHIIV